MGIDIRLPIGLMFTIMAIILVVHGLTSNPEIYDISLGININLEWGLVLLGFGGLMLLFGSRSAKPEAAGEDDLPR
jgi:hypothetical protein